MPRPRPRPAVRVTLTGGPCHGQSFTVSRALWEYGTIFAYAPQDGPWIDDPVTPYAPLPPAHVYRRQLMGYRATPTATPRYWYEWHCEGGARG